MSDAIVRAREGAATLTATAAALSGRVEILALETQQDREQAAVLLRAVEGCVRDAEAERKAIVAPLKAETAAIDAVYREPRRILEGIAEQIRRRLAEAAERQDRAEREAHRIALDRARAAQEATTPEEASQAVRAANAALATVPAAGSNPAGISHRFEWVLVSYEIGDLPPEYTQRIIHTGMIQGEIDAATREGREPKVRGCRFERRARTVVRR